MELFASCFFEGFNILQNNLVVFEIKKNYKHIGGISMERRSYYSYDLSFLESNIENSNPPMSMPYNVVLSGFEVMVQLP
jgi:hypothetical protein